MILSAITLMRHVTMMWAMAFVAALGVAAVWQLRRRLRGSTLMAAANWSLAALVALGLASLAGSDGFAPNWRYLASVLTLAPNMAVMGAKRPQDRAWQCIVVALLVTLAMPVGESLLYQNGTIVSLHAVRGAFVIALWLAGFGNYLPTRLVWSAVFAGVGQLMLLAPYLAPLGGDDYDRAWVGGVVCLALAPYLALRVLRGSLESQENWHHAWLAFRDQVGVVWALRVQERFNATARDARWPVRITWLGMVDEQGQATAELNPEAARCLTALLSRFVSTHDGSAPHAGSK